MKLDASAYYYHASLVTENNFELTWRGTLVHERRAIMGISKRGWTSVLEKLRKARSPTRLRTVVVVPTAQLVRTKRLATTLTSHHGAVTRR